MKSRQSTGYFLQVYIRLLFCFISSVVFAASAYALTGNLIDQCSDCHGTNNVPGPADIRPNDLTYRNITTGAFVGNHRTHMATVANLSNVCTPCHGPAPAAMDHRNGVITMRQHINSSATLRGTYSKPVFFNQTSAPNLGTCSKVNCHFQKASTPSWGFNAYTYTNPTTNDCAQCHGNGTTLSAPQDGSHPNTINKHGLYYGSDASSCAKCHANYTTFSHATSAGHRALILQGTDFPVTAIYSKITNLAYPAYLTTTPANRNGTCTTLYCHSQGTGGTSQGGDVRPISAPAVVPTWGGTVDCSYCHTGGTTTGPTYVSGSPKANSHNAHRVTNGYTCNICHYATTTNGTTIATLANHANKTYNLLADPSKSFTYTYASTGGTCKTSTCHGGAGINLAWGASRGTTQCTKCHGTQSAAIGTIWSSASVAPGSATGGDLAGNLNVSARGGVHQGHLTAATGISDKIHCGECHKVVTTVNTATHMRYTTARPVFSGNLATAQSHTPSVTRTSGIINCNNTYCHTGKLNTGAAMTPAWNNSIYLAAVMTMTDCKKCHNMPPNPGVAGVHSGIPAALTTFPVGATCSCHSNLTTGGTTYATIFTDKTKHINGNIEGGHAFPYPGATHDGATGATTPATSCSGTSCHNVVAAGPYPVAAGIAPNCMGCHTIGILRTVATISCYDCHGSGAAATAAWPNGTVFPNNNRSHTAHTTITGITCDYCHTGGGTGTATHGASNRIAKTQANVVVALGAQAGTAATWTLGTETCGTSVCHGQQSPGWGITASTTQCTKCHGQANAAYLTNYSSAVIAPGGAGRDTGGKTLSTDPRVGAHQAHLLASSNISDKMHCGECHVKVTAVADVTHLNYTTATVTFANAVLAKKGTVAHNPTATKVSGIISCNTTYCHTGNYAGGTAPTPVWNNSTLLAGTIADCTKCHSLPPNPGVAGSHLGEATVTTIAGLNQCSSQPGGITGCHPSINGTPTLYTNIFFDKLLHINGSVEGGTCVGCHAAVLASPTAQGLGGPANRRNVVAEHKNVWSHKRSSAGGVPANTVVTNADCIVCHMEGDKVSGGTTAVHKDGYIDLRDPDTGLQIKNVTWNGATPGAYVAGATDLRFVQFSRNLAVTLEADPNWLVIAAIQINHCLKCHDTNGANNLNAQVPTGATAWKPFGVAIIGHAAPFDSNGSGNVVDVNKSLLTTNATYHPVRGKQNNGFADINLLSAPWNVKTGAGTAAVYGPLMSCWDCHAPAGAAGAQTQTVTAHGGPATLRSPIWAGGSTSSANLCLVCHLATAYPSGNGNHGANSAFTGGKSNMGSSMPLCHTCHSTFTDARPVRAEDVHGFNDKTPGTAGSKWTSGSRPYAFFRTSRLGDWAPKLAAGDSLLRTSTCNSGGCSNGNMNGSNGIVGTGGTY